MNNKKEITNNYLVSLIEGHSIKPSFQRILILKYLIEMKNHPSVEMIFKHLVKDIPILSKTTVYNTLNLFSKKGLVTALTIDDIELKYDFIETPHAHFMCNNCHNIFDIDLQTDIFNLGNIKGHRIDESQVNFKGVCADCAE